MRRDTPRILLVDDVKTSIKILHRSIREAEPSWIVEVASSPSRAMQLITDGINTKNPFAVLVTDLHMDNDIESGVKLMKEIQRVDPLVMTILYSGFTDLIKQLYERGLDAFDVVGKAELGEVAAARRILDRTRAALRYRSWAVRVGVLRRYFDPGLFETMSNQPAWLEAKSRPVSITFWDIRGFSRLCDTMREHPDLIAGFLREYCEVVARSIFNEGGLLDKFMGDGVMALFGAFDDSPSGQKTGAIGAVQAAINVRREFGELIRRWTPRWEMHVAEVIEAPRLACGIHTAKAIVGNMGTDFRDQFTAVGPHVNFAQRLESLAAQGGVSQILVSQPTSMYIGGSVDLAPFREVDDVKNIRGVFKIFNVVGDTVHEPV